MGARFANRIGPARSPALMRPAGTTAHEARAGKRLRMTVQPGHQIKVVRAGAMKSLAHVPACGTASATKSRTFMYSRRVAHSRLVSGISAAGVS